MLPSTHPTPVLFLPASQPLLAVVLVRCAPCDPVGSLCTLGGEYLERRDEWCKSRLQPLIYII